MDFVGPNGRIGLCLQGERHGRDSEIMTGITSWGTDGWNVAEVADFF